MNKEYAERLNELLQSERKEYSSKYKWEWNSDTECCDVTIEILGTDYYIATKYDNNTNNILVEISADVWEAVRETDSTIKYFWIVLLR